MNIKTNTQLVSVLLFKRYCVDDVIPDRRNIGFKDRFGINYILTMQRYFIIDKLDIEDAEKFICKRVYDINRNKEDYERLVNILSTAKNFKEVYESNQDNINCIIMIPGRRGEYSDLIDEDGISLLENLHSLISASFAWQL